MSKPTQPAKLNSNRYLRCTGAFPWLREGFLCVIFLYGLVEWMLGGQTEGSANIVLLFFPAFAVTGIASIAKSGQLDLLFGAGKGRFGVIKSAALRALGIPFVLGALLSANAGTQPHGVTLVRAFAVMLFTGGLGFLTGLSYPRYWLAGIWLVARIAFVLSPTGLRFMAHARASSLGGAPLPTGTSLLAIVSFPEVLLVPGVNLAYCILPAAVGIVAIGAAAMLFEVMDFAGKRLV